VHGVTRIGDQGHNKIAQLPRPVDHLVDVWFGASIVCLRFLAERFCADGRGFSHRSSEASRRETLTGSSPVCIIRSKTKAQQPFHLEKLGSSMGGN
jgi:hypothetical protein